MPVNIIYNTYPWAFDVPGGGERQLMAYKNHLAKSDVSVDLFDVWNPQLERYDIFHAFGVMRGMTDVCDYVKRKGLKLVVSPNLWITRETKVDYAVEHIWNMLYLADRIIANSEIEAHNMSDVFSIDREKFYVVYNGVERDFVYPVDQVIFREKYKINRPFLLNVANIEPRKNQLRLISALKEHPEIDLVIVGHVRDVAYSTECLRIGGDQVKIVGPLPYNSELLRSAVAGCALFVMPSLLETPSIAALEAAAGGARILITGVGSAREYFGESVTYVDPMSHASISQGISKGLQATAESSAWVVTDRYLWEKCIPSLTACYKTLLKV